MPRPVFRRRSAAATVTQRRRIGGSGAAWRHPLALRRRISFVVFVGCDPPDGTARPRYRRTTSLDAETPALTIERRRHAFPALAHDHRLRHRPEGPFFGDDEIPRLAASIIATRPAGAPPFSIAWRGFHLLADERFEPRRA